MKLSNIAKQVIKEDTWGNNPSAAAPSNPGKTPNAVPPAPQPVGGAKFYDVSKDYQSFENTIEKEEEKAKKAFEATLSQNLTNKKVVTRAGKGSVGQIEKDYTIDVVSVSVSYMNEKFYIILKGKDKKDYYVNTGFKIKVLGSAEETPEPEASTLTASNSGTPIGKKPLGMAQPQNLGLASNRSVGVPQ